MNLIYIFPMMLGRTFNLHNYKVGINIFPQDQLNKTQIHSNPYVNQGKEIAKDWRNLERMFDIPIDLSLKIKAGFVELKEIGDIFKNYGMIENTIYVLFYLNKYSHSYYLPYDAKPILNWSQYNKNILGTHYVRVITYGCKLAVLFAITAHDDNGTDNIENILRVSNFSQTLTAQKLVEKYKELETLVQGIADVKLSFYSNLNTKSTPQTLEGLHTVLQRFKRNILFPANVELQELSALDNSFHFKENAALISKLKMFEYYFDDLRKTKSRATEWMKKFSKKLNNEYKDKIKEFLNKVDTVLKTFVDAIGWLNIEEGPEQLNDSIEAYKANGSTILGKYLREFQQLRMNAKQLL
uniref:Venom protein n=1 Tax=Hadrurus spadix TaxID=141984 RepID=A0A1W7R9A4_9SCOR